ncbi:MAG: hypothetical protein GY738_23185 [Pseudoalteromonas sp.]|nr:hypothetical protein [Pseudoalteromonas sp.]
MAVATLHSESDDHDVTTASVKVTCAVDNNNAALSMANVPICNPQREDSKVQIYCFLDSGSMRSFISTSLAKKLVLKPIRSATLTVSTFGTTEKRRISADVAQIRLSLKNGSYKDVYVHVVDLLTDSLQKTPLSASDKQVLKQLSPDTLAMPLCMLLNQEAVKPDLIIGNDYMWDFLQPADKQQLPSGLYLLGSSLGLLLGGCPGGGWPKGQEVHQHMALVKSEQSNLERFWDLETLGIKDNLRENDDVALAQFNSTIKFQDGRYAVCWPKKEGVTLPDNYGLAMGRFKSLTKRLQEDPDLFSKYCASIQDQIDRDVIEQIDETQVDGPIHYLPHHPVLTPGKVTTKVRLVYDASAKLRPHLHSLNETLYRGPITLPDLAGLLLRFRLCPVAIVADVEKAFHQLSLQVTDRDVTRFFWYRDTSKLDASFGNVAIYRFKRVPFGVLSSPFLLEATLRYHLQQQKTELSNKLMSNFYVDNLLTGTADARAAQELYVYAKNVLDKASMNLREWASNNQTFIDTVPEVDRAKSTHQKVLGLSWDTERDTLWLPPVSTSTSESTTTTLRQVLSFVSGCYDPLGFVSPAILQGKLFIQSLWNLNLDWDTPIPDEKVQEWNSLCDGFSDLKEYSLLRYIGLRMAESTPTYTLIAFADASGKAYAAVIYL